MFRGLLCYCQPSLSLNECYVMLDGGQAPGERPVQGASQDPTGVTG